MGRLIDADALIEKFNDTGIQITFDLPVEEILGEEVDIDDFSMLVQDAIQAYRKMVIDTIQNQPTTYDVDAVVGVPGNDGWIPCSERLPEIGTLVLATTESGNVCDDVLIYDYECSTSKEPCFHMWDDEMWNCYTPRVIAWQPLPAPYQPKGEQHE